MIAAIAQRHDATSILIVIVRLVIRIMDPPSGLGAPQPFGVEVYWPRSNGIFAAVHRCIGPAFAAADSVGWPRLPPISLGWPTLVRRLAHQKQGRAAREPPLGVLTGGGAKDGARADNMSAVQLRVESN